MTLVEQLLGFLILTRIGSQAGISRPMFITNPDYVISVDDGFSVTASSYEPGTLPQDALRGGTPNQPDSNRATWTGVNYNSDEYWQVQSPYDFDAVFFISISLQLTNAKSAIISVTDVAGRVNTIDYSIDDNGKEKWLFLTGRLLRIHSFVTTGDPQLKDIAINVYNICPNTGYVEEGCLDACNRICTTTPNAVCSVDGCNYCATTYYDILGNDVECDTCIDGIAPVECGSCALDKCNTEPTYCYADPCANCAARYFKDNQQVECNVCPGTGDVEEVCLDVCARICTTTPNAVCAADGCANCATTHVDTLGNVVDCDKCTGGTAPVECDTCVLDMCSTEPTYCYADPCTDCAVRYFKDNEEVNCKEYYDTCLENFYGPVYLLYDKCTGDAAGRCRDGQTCYKAYQQDCCFQCPEGDQCDGA